MIEAELLLLLFSCIMCVVFAWLIISWDIYYKNYESNTPMLLLPITKDTNNIEFIVRELIYKLSEQDIYTEVMLLDNGAENETLEIFKKLMSEQNEYIVFKIQ